MKLSFSHRGLAMPGSTCCLAIWITYVDASIIRRHPWQLPGRLSRWSADQQHDRANYRLESFCDTDAWLDQEAVCGALSC